MRNASFAGTTIFGLVKELAQEVKSFIKEEAQLAKLELKDKAAKASRNSVGLAIGGVVAYAGLIVVFLGLGGLLGFGLQKLGLQPLLAAALGVLVFGLLAAAIGTLLVLKGIKAFSRESMAPQRTLKTLQAFKGVESPAKTKDTAEVKKDERTVQQIEKSILVTETKLDNTLHELSRRLTFRHAKETAGGKIQLHPYRWGGAALGIGVITSYLVKRKLHRQSA
jgi:hypothetical protein